LLVLLKLVRGNLLKGEDYWTFGQIFAVINMTTLAWGLITQYTRTQSWHEQITSSPNRGIYSLWVVGVPNFIISLMELSFKDY
jgi:hypothetical protein